MKRMDRLAEIGCIVCLLEMGVHSAPEIHHLRAGKGMGQRASDDETIPLCPVHHRLGPHGVGFHSGPREWQKWHGGERELLTAVNRILEAGTKGYPGAN